MASSHSGKINTVCLTLRVEIYHVCIEIWLSWEASYFDELLMIIPEKEMEPDAQNSHHFYTRGKLKAGISQLKSVPLKSMIALVSTLYECCT